MKAALKVGWQVRTHWSVIRSPSKIGRGGVGGDAGRRAVDVQGRRAGGDRAVVEPDLVGLDRGDVAQAHHVADAAQLLELAVAEDGAVVGGRGDGGVDPAQLVARLQPEEDVVDGVGLHHGLDLVGEALGEPGEELVAGLEVGPVQHPRVPRHDPGDPVGVGAVVEQPDAGVHPGLAGPDHHEPVVVGRRRGAGRSAARRPRRARPRTTAATSRAPASSSGWRRRTGPPTPGTARRRGAR